MQPTSEKGEDMGKNAMVSQPMENKTKRTPEQQIAFYQEKIHKIKAEQSKRARNERTRRLCAGSGLIEKITGLELTEENARAIAQAYLNSQKHYSPREAHIEQQLRASATSERRETVHQLKVLVQYADAIMSGDKTFEIRKNDRDYKVGDKVIFNVITSEGMPKEHPLNGKIYWINYILDDYEGLAQTYVALAIHKDYCPGCGGRVVE